MGDQIVTLGHLNPSEVQAAYRSADALIFPSILETAGLPIIEAMEYGLPILASDLGFAHELCGDAAGFFDPYSAASVACAIMRFRDDMGYHEELSQRSSARLSEHVKDWDDVLEEVIRVEGLRSEGGLASKIE